MKKTVSVILILALLLGMSGCKKKFDPAAAQAVSRLEVHGDYDPLSIIRTDTSEYQVKVLSNNILIDSLGSYRIVFEVSKGDQSKEFEYTVSVVDTTKPVLELKEPYEIETGTVFADVFLPEEHFSAVDNYDGDITSKITYSGNVDTSSAGKREIKVTVSDSSSNTTTMTVSVEVVGLNVDIPDPIVIDDPTKVGSMYEGPLDSSLVLYTDNTFAMVANTCDGYTTYYGTYESSNSEVTLYIDGGYLVDGQPQSRTLKFAKDGYDLIYSSLYEQCSPARNQVYKRKN